MNESIYCTQIYASARQFRRNQHVYMHNFGCETFVAHFHPPPIPLIIKASFSQPDADIGMVLPVIVACFTPFPLLFGAAVHHTIKYIRTKRKVGKFYYF